METAVRRLVRDRADHRCEYCRTRQADEPFFRHQIEHVIARQHGGGDEIENLALACPHCNRHKGPNLTGIDPDTGTITPLFHPRRQDWTEHFQYRGQLIVGLTAVGRTTVRLLSMNAPLRVELRTTLGRRTESSEENLTSPQEDPRGNLGESP